MGYVDKDKQREYQKIWMRKRRAFFFGDKHCKYCGSKTNLEIHHKNPSKKITHCIWSWKKERREKELAKCIVLCRTCHIELHAEQRRKPLIHGTTAGYDKKCRCEKCREAHKIAMREYRKNKKLGLDKPWQNNIRLV